MCGPLLVRIWHTDGVCMHKVLWACSTHSNAHTNRNYILYFVAFKEKPAVLCKYTIHNHYMFNSWNAVSFVKLYEFSKNLGGVESLFSLCARMVKVTFKSATFSLKVAG